MSQDTFVSIAEDFYLPFSYLRMLQDSSTVFVDVQNRPNKRDNNIQSMHPSPIWTTPTAHDERAGFMMQNSFTTTAQFSVALSYDPKRCLTSALVHGLFESEISTLIEQITENRDCIALPMLLTSLLLNSREASANSKVCDCHQAIVKVENETGIRTNWHPNKPCCSVGTIAQRKLERQNRYDSLDFDRLTANLTSLSSKLA